MARRKQVTKKTETAAAPPSPVDALCKRLGIGEPTPSLPIALTHPSFTNERPERSNNQRLEFLGDAVLGLCVSEVLMAEFAEVDEGELTVMRSSLVNAGALAKLAREIDLGAALLLGKGAEAGGERQRKNVLADAMEAVFGAVFLDLGLDACRHLTERLFSAKIGQLAASGGIPRDAKSRLQEWLQARKAPPPVYEVVGTEGPPHARTFVVRAIVDAAEGVPGLSADGQGRSKKLAEQDAAHRCLDELERRTAPP